MAKSGSPNCWCNPRPLLLAGGLLFLAGGCAVDTYDNQLEKAGKYLDDVDKENQYCGNPIDIPEKKKEEKKGGGAPAAPGGPPGGAPPGGGGGGPPSLAALLGGPAGFRDYFFRPPKGIGTSGTEVKDDLIYKYLKEAPAAQPVVAGGADQKGLGPPDPAVALPVGEMYFAISRGKMNMKEFQEAVFTCNNIIHAEIEKQTQRVTLTSLVGKPLQYEEFVDRGRQTQFYFLNQDVGQTSFLVAVVFKMKQNPDAKAVQDFDNQKQYSLRSLALGSDAALRLKNFKPR